MKKILFLILLVVLLMSCRSLKQPESIIMPSVNPVPPAVQHTFQIEEFTDGVFILTDDWAKILLNHDAMKEEIELLRAELSKFE